MSSIHQLSSNVVSCLRSQVVVASVAQCISELIQNSIDASATRIDVTLHSEDLYISVKDNGCGITPEDMKYVGAAHCMCDFVASDCVALS